MKLEPMDSFFNTRVEGYDDHMRTNVDGGDVFYEETVKWLPKEGEINLLDLGCGTGLELDEYFKINPHARVTGIDMAEAMTDRLLDKHKDRKDQIKIINGDYMTTPFGQEAFDAAISVQTMHHFLDESKLALYKKLFAAIKPGGVYVETDYMAPDEDYEAFYISEYHRLRTENGIKDGFYHYDIPFTVDHQKRLLLKAGFTTIDLVWKQANTCILICRR